MGINLVGVGLSGINAAEAELQATESNITNANNPNYSVESVQLAARPGPEGNGIGVDIVGTQRAQAPFLTGELNQAQSSESYNSSYAQVTQLAQTYLAPASGNDLLQSLQAVFNSFTNLSASPQDPATRQAAINAAGNFATMSQQLSTQLNQASANEFGTLPEMVQQVNSDSQQIAQLNTQIQATSASSGNAAALLDQRDALVSNLANLIGATGDSNGNVTVAGVPLVSGGLPLSLSMSGTGTATAVEIQMPSGSLALSPDDIGGEIGGSLSGANRVAQLSSDLNSFVVSVGNAINAQHQQGFGLDGSTNNQLFLIGAGSNGIALNPAINEQNLAASKTAAGVPGDGSNAAAIAALANASGLDPSFPSSTPGQAYAQIASDFGSDVQAATSAQSTASASVQSFTQLKSSITGVSLNQELTSLIQYQYVVGLEKTDGSRNTQCPMGFIDRNTHSHKALDDWQPHGNHGRGVSAAPLAPNRGHRVARNRGCHRVQSRFFRMKVRNAWKARCRG